MVHALQAQHLNLNQTFKQEKDSDRALSYQSVIEGDATLAMLAYLASLVNVPFEVFVQKMSTIGDQIKEHLQGGQVQISTAPAIVRVSLLSPYMDGLMFMAEQYRRGGWEAVDAAHRDLPKSMEQILHPEKYLDREPPRSLKLPELSNLRTQGYTLVKRDTLGELELSVFFAKNSGEDRNAKAASGWAGDRLHVYRSTEGEGAAVWLTAWDSPGHAKRAEAAALRAGARTLRDQQMLLILCRIPEPIAPTLAALRKHGVLGNAQVRGSGRCRAPRAVDGPASPQ